jgi:gamma-tubulin complex component 3
MFANPSIELNHEWHKARLVLAEMIHFIRQLEAYCRLEVIECSWKVLTEFLHKKEGDLDALIEAHRNYLDRMTRKILLWSPKHGKEELLLRQLMEIFTCVLQFREALVSILVHWYASFILKRNRTISLIIAWLNLHEETSN